MLSAPPPARLAAPALPHAGTQNPRACSILVVDEDATSAYAMLDALRPTAHRRVYAASADIARVLARDGSFDVIFVSLSRQGIGLLMDLKRSGNARVVAIVGGWGYCPVNYQLRMATAIGVQGTLQKPASPQRVRIAVERALSAPV